MVLEGGLYKRFCVQVNHPALVQYWQMLFCAEYLVTIFVRKQSIIYMQQIYHSVANCHQVIYSSCFLPCELLLCIILWYTMGRCGLFLKSWCLVSFTDFRCLSFFVLFVIYILSEWSKCMQQIFSWRNF